MGVVDGLLKIPWSGTDPILIERGFREIVRYLSLLQGVDIPDDEYFHLPGRPGGQIGYGGSGSGDNLELHSNPLDDGFIDFGCGCRFCEDDTTIISGEDIDFSPAATLVAGGGGVVHNVLNIAPAVDVETTVFIYSDILANGKFNQKASDLFSSFIGVNAIPELYSEDATYNPLSCALFRAAPETSCRAAGDVGTVALVAGLLFSPSTDSRLDGSDMRVTNITAVDCSPTYQTRHANAAFTVDAVRGLWLKNPVKQLAGQDLGTETYTDYLGLDMEDLTKPVNAYTVRSFLAPSATHWFLFNPGGARSFLDGDLLFREIDDTIRIGSADAGYMDYFAPTAHRFDSRVEAPSHSIPTRHIQCEVFTDAGINACMAELGASGGKVYLPKATYVITGPITIPVANITLQGAGKGSILDASAGQAFTVITGAAKDNTVIRDLQIIGKTGEAGSNYLIYLNNCDKSEISGCLLQDADHSAILLASSEDAVICNNFIVGGGFGVWLNNTGQVVVERNIIIGSDYGIYATSAASSRCKICNNIISDTTDFGIKAYQCDHIDIQGNQVYSPGGMGIELDDALTCRIIDNTVFEPANARNDIYCRNGSAGAIIIGNHCISSAGESERGIYLADAPNSIVQGNDSEGHDTCGIQIDAASTGCSTGGNILLDATPMIDNGGPHEYRVYGGFKAGGVTDYSEFEADGTLKFTGAAKVWDDIQFDTDSGKVPAANAPTWEALTPNTSAFAFAVDEYKDLKANEYGHAYKEGEIAHMHAHVTIKTAQATGADRFVKLQVWVAYVDRTASVWAEVNLSAEVTIPTGSSALQIFYLDLGNVDLSGYSIETQIKARIKRIAATGGTEYADDVYITQVGAHLAKDTAGSRTENAK